MDLQALAFYLFSAVLLIAALAVIAARLEADARYR